MKLTTFLLLITVLQVFARGTYSQTTDLTLNLGETTVGSVLQEIENQSEFYFLFNQKLVDTNRKVNLRVTDIKINDVLARVFKGTNVDYVVIDRQIVLSPPEYLAEIKTGMKESQQRQVSGQVRDAGTGELLPGVNVVVQGTTTGTITDHQGRYTLDIPDGEVVLVFSYVGYQRVEIPVGAREVIDVELESELEQLDEVVVIGYGARKSRDVTTSISQISSESLEKSISMSPELAMQGRMAGVQVGGTSGSPLNRPTIRIRGVNTWGISSPLYVIDGVPVTEYGSGYEAIEDSRSLDARGPLNIMATIDPNDIESISVLKDASAAAIYGVRAANGVILITTKTGKIGVPRVQFRSRYGISNIHQRWDLLNTTQYTAHVQKVHASDPTIEIPPQNEGLFDPSDPRYLGDSPTYDWQDAIVNRNAPTQEYALSLSGATENTDYYVSGSYSDTEGVFLRDNLKRYSGSFKLNTRITKWLKFGLNYRLSYSKGIGPSSSVNFNSAAATPPWQPIYGDGPWGYAPVVEGFLPDGSYSTEVLYGAGTHINSLGTNKANETSYFDNTRQLGNAYLEIEPLQNLIIRGRISADIYTTVRDGFRDLEGNVFSYTLGDPAKEAGSANSVGIWRLRPTENNNWIKEIFVNYANSFGKHNIDLLFSGMDQRYNSEYIMMDSKYMSTTLEYLRVFNAEPEFTAINSNISRHSLQGLLWRAGYNFNYTYYLDLTLRRDGSARFAPENRWGLFPAVSAAWRMKNMAFMEPVEWINDLKLRAGWGQLGNQEVRNMAYLSAIDTRPSYAWGDSGDGRGYFSYGATVFGLPNIGLQWEKTSTLNAGFDAILFGGLSLTMEYYSKLTDGILQTVALPNSAGVTEQPVDNIASVRNNGFEVALNYAGRIGQLEYSLGGNFTLNNNEVISMYQGVPDLAGGIEEGYPLFYVRGYKLDGTFQNQGEIDQWMANYSDDNYQEAKIGPGDFYFQDLRGEPEEEGEFYTEEPDGVVNTFDQVYLGKSIPGHFYGFNFNLAYRGFDLGASFTGIGDVVKMNGTRKSLENTAAAANNMLVTVLDSWTPENTNTDMPRIMRNDPAGNFRNSDYWLESAAYMRLTNMQLGYTLPETFYSFTNNNISHLRIYVGASNLFTVTPWTGLDPEDDNYPIPRTFFMGLNARF
ncbi:MAG: TonB-dependent receptor [Bacteroidales bacterium]